MLVAAEARGLDPEALALPLAAARLPAPAERELASEPAKRGVVKAFVLVSATVGNPKGAKAIAFAEASAWPLEKNLGL